MKLAISIFTALFLISVGVQSDTGSNIPDEFLQSDEKSDLMIRYDDLTILLTKSVLHMGESNRGRALKAVAPIGTKFKAKKDQKTALEGNRFFYRAYTKNSEILKLLVKIRQDLEMVPSQVPMNKLSSKEQLAYWLNLYNVTLLEQISLSDKRDMNKALYGPKGILQQKLLNLKGQLFSLNDIQYGILAKKWADYPEVIYGLHQGVIGGPSIRKKAYVGSKVFKQLRSNAKEFVNSNRGAYALKSRSMNVSYFYEQNKMFFPDFDRNLKTHLLEFSQDKMRSRILTATSFSPSIKNWTLASLVGNYRQYGQSVNNNAGASMMDNRYGDAVQQTTIFTSFELSNLRELNMKRKKNKGVITIEEQSPASASKKKDNKKKN